MEEEWGISKSVTGNYVSPPEFLRNSVKNFSYFEIVFWLLDCVSLTMIHPEITLVVKSELRGRGRVSSMGC